MRRLTIGEQTLTDEQVIQAMARFDQEERPQFDSGQWRKYAIQRDGRLYPPGRILQLMTDGRIGGFAQGERARTIFQQLGFQVVASPAAMSAGVIDVVLEDEGEPTDYAEPVEAESPIPLGGDWAGIEGMDIDLEGLLMAQTPRSGIDWAGGVTAPTVKLGSWSSQQRPPAADGPGWPAGFGETAAADPAEVRVAPKKPDPTLEKLNRAIKASRAGNRVEAMTLLAQVIKVNPRNEAAWLWYAFNLPSDPDRIRALQECLFHNPDCQEAHSRLVALRRNVELREQRLKQQMAKLLLGIDQAESKVADLEASLAQQQQELKEAERRYAEATEAVAATERKLAEVRTELSQLQDQLADLE